MSEIVINLGAVEHNLHVVRGLEREKGFTLLPVVKMIAAFPPVLEFLRVHGYTVTGIADIDEVEDPPGPEEAGRHALINLWPLGRAEEVIRRFTRSPVSSLESLRALEGAAAALGLRRSALFMLDLGDGREGAQLAELPALLEQIARERFTHIDLIGLGATLGCLHGVSPSQDNMLELEEAVRLMEDRLGRPPALISLGGSVYLERLTRHPGCPHLPTGCQLELRAGDPLFLGYDIYRNCPFPEGAFRDDTFQFRAEVLEVKEKEFILPAVQILNGRGEPGAGQEAGRRTRALLNFGSLHTQVDDLELELPGARLAGYCANYTVLDMAPGSAAPRLGDMVNFRAGYWAVARAFRSLSVRKRCL